MEYIINTTDYHIDGPTAITLGKFDGLHLGHKLLLKHVLEKQKLGAKAVIFTFNMPPGTQIDGNFREVLTTNDERRIFAEESGVDYLIECPFVPEVMSMEPLEFIRDIVEKLNVKWFVVGKDFRFGHKRQGDYQTLQKHAEEFGYEVIVVEKEQCGGRDISSSYIREEIQAGNVEKANRLLGYPFTIRGEVLHGRKLGRNIGIPTTNLIPSKEKLLPPNGVYISIAAIGKKEYPSITNIGYKPTVGATEKKGVETYIFNFEGDVYGKVIHIKLLHYQRDEMKFGSIEELKTQMEQDIENARLYFEEGKDKIEYCIV